MALGDVLPDAQALGFVKPAAVGHDLNGHHAAEFSHGAAGKQGFASSVCLPLAFGGGAVPAENIDEQAGEVKSAEVFLKGWEVKLGHGCCVCFLFLFRRSAPSFQPPGRDSP